VVIASNNFDSALPRLSGRDVTESDYRPFLPGVGCLLLANEREFRVKKPDARTAGLMAEVNQRKGLSMTKQPNGIWTIKVSIPRGTYGYKFLVDEKDWVFDPNNSGRQTLDGVENSSIRRSVVENGAPRDSSLLFPYSLPHFFLPRRYAHRIRTRKWTMPFSRRPKSPKKMGVKMPDVKKQLEEVNKKEAKEKAALQKQLEAPGPLPLPDWTPKVPQFEPTSPVSRKIVNDEVNIYPRVRSHFSQWY
jgi:hypothetical protein